MSSQTSGLNREITQLEILEAIQALPSWGKTYTVDFQSYTANSVVESECNEILFINVGTKTAVVNGFTMKTGTQFSISGNAGETDITEYDLSFEGIGDPEMLVIRKIYTA